MTKENMSIGDLASALAGSGLTQITSNLMIALGLIAAAVVLKVLVAYLNKEGIEVTSHV